MDKLIKRNNLVAGAKTNGLAVKKLDSVVGVLAARRTSGQWRRRSSVMLPGKGMDLTIYVT